MVKAALHGAHLAYRQGVYANPQGAATRKLESAQLQIDCNNYLDATEIAFTARSMPADSPNQIKFSLTIDAGALSLPQTADGSHQLTWMLLCALQRETVAAEADELSGEYQLSSQQFDKPMSTGKLADTIRVPGPKPPALRLLVKDMATGKLGSVYIKTGDLVADVPKPGDDPNAVFQ